MCALWSIVSSIPFSFVLLCLCLRITYRYIVYHKYVYGSVREWIGSKLVKFGYIKHMYETEILKYYKSACAKNRHTWMSEFTLHTTIPDTGLTYTQCETIINQYVQSTTHCIQGKHFSGTIYPDTSIVNTDWIKPEPNDNEYQQLQKLYAKIFVHANLWNVLHTDEFPATSAINYQLTAMVSDLFGGVPDQCMGLVTSGGTQSIMTAARAYRNYGVTRGTNSCDCVIIAPQTIHASLMKAADAYNFKLILVPTDIHGQVNVTELEHIVAYHRSQLCALFCSYPSYPYGTRDDYSTFIRLARQYNVGLHIDCCLGGFICNFEPLAPKFLNIEGVTSISVDTHKNGLAPKGSSLLLCKNLYEHNLVYYAIHTTIDWPGGLYGTPKDDGSQSCVPAFCALITLLFLGKSRYAEIAANVKCVCDDLATWMAQHKGIEVIGGPSINVIAFKIHNKPGANYALCDKLKEQGFVLSAVGEGCVHICVTERFANNDIIKFKQIFETCYNEVITCDTLDSHARLYCSLDSMLVPKASELRVSKFLENYFLGRLGVRDSIRYHFLANINPVYENGKCD